MALLDLRALYDNEMVHSFNATGLPPSAPPLPIHVIMILRPSTSCHLHNCGTLCILHLVVA